MKTITVTATFNVEDYCDIPQLAFDLAANMQNQTNGFINSCDYLPDPVSVAAHAGVDEVIIFNLCVIDENYNPAPLIVYPTPPPE